jgi:hypothetical protein
VEIAGTTHKTVKRVIARHEAGGGAPERAPRGHNYDNVTALEGAPAAAGGLGVQAQPESVESRVISPPRAFLRLTTVALTCSASGLMSEAVTSVMGLDPRLG